MKRYALIFAVTYLVLSLALLTILEILKSDDNPSFNLIIALAASFVAAGKFVKENGYLPTPEQTKAYSLMALLATWIVSILIAVVAFSVLLTPEEFSSILNLAKTSFFWILAFTTMFILSLVYYYAIKWSFSWYAKQTLGK